MNREEMIRDTEEKLEALRAGYEEYLWLESYLQWLKGPSAGEDANPAFPSVKKFILGVMADGKAHKASELHRLLSEHPDYAWMEITRNSVYSRAADMAREGLIVTLPSGEGYKIAPANS